MSDQQGKLVGFWASRWHADSSIELRRVAQSPCTVYTGRAEIGFQSWTKTAILAWNPSDCRHWTQVFCFVRRFHRCNSANANSSEHQWSELRNGPLKLCGPGVWVSSYQNKKKLTGPSISNLVDKIKKYLRKYEPLLISLNHLIPGADHWSGLEARHTPRWPRRGLQVPEGRGGDGVQGAAPSAPDVAEEPTTTAATTSLKTAMTGQDTHRSPWLQMRTRPEYAIQKDPKGSIHDVSKRKQNVIVAMAKHQDGGEVAAAPTPPKGEKTAAHRLATSGLGSGWSLQGVSCDSHLDN